MAKVIYLLKYSCARTLSMKHGKRLGSYRAVFRKYGKDLTVVKDGKVVAQFGSYSCAKVRSLKAMRSYKLRPMEYIGVLDRRRFKALKLLDAECFACGTKENIEIHHVRRISSMKADDYLKYR